MPDALNNDAQYLREADSALRGLRDGEGAFRLTPGADPAAVSSVAVGRQWFERLLMDRKSAHADFKAREQSLVDRACYYKATRNATRELYRAALEDQSKTECKLDRIPRWVRRIFKAL